MNGMSQLVESYGRVWNADAPAGLVDEIFAPDVVDRNPQPGQSTGRDGIRQVLQQYHSAFPDLQVQIRSRSG